MAAKQEEQEHPLSDRVRGALQSLLGKLFTLVLIVVAMFIIYKIIVGDPPRAQYTTPEATLNAYTAFVAPYVGPNAGRPSITNVDDFLDFFDEDSRRWFDENYNRLASQRYTFNQQEFAQLDDDSLRVEAMSYLISLSPLSGMARIVEQRKLENGDVQAVVAARNSRPTPIVLEKRGDLYYIKDFAGVQERALVTPD